MNNNTVTAQIRSCLNLISRSFSTRLFLIISCGLSVFPATAAAQSSELSENTIARPEFSAGLNAESLIQVLIALILVVLIIFALSFVLKKFNMLPGGSSGLIKIVDAISLGSKDRLLLVQVGDDQMLISASPGRISKLHKLTASVVPEQISSTENPEKSGFSNILDLVISRRRS